MGNLTLKNQPKPDHLLKVTSLIYLKDAILSERFEDCAELSQNAKKFGATQNEVNEVIAESLRQFKSGRSYEAKPTRKGRLR